eukprot:UN04252
MEFKTLSQEAAGRKWAVTRPSSKGKVWLPTSHEIHHETSRGKIDGSNQILARRSIAQKTRKAKREVKPWSKKNEHENVMQRCKAAWKGSSGT